MNGALEAWKIYVGKDEEDRTGLGRAELLYRSTDDAMLEVFLRREFSVGRLAQIGWLSEPLHRVDADCSGCTNLKMQTHGKHTEKKSAPFKTHSPATASNSRRHVRKHVTRVSPYCPASIDPGFVEIGLVHLSQSVKTTNVTHTDRHTDRLL